MTETEKHIEIWDDCLHIFEQLIEPDQFNMWFRRIVPVSFDKSTLVVEVPSSYFKEYLEGAYLDVIRKTLKRVIGADARLCYSVRTVSNQPPMKVTAAESNTPVNRPMNLNSVHPTGNPGPMVYPGLRKLRINPRLNENFNFSNFVEGECNRIGISAGRDIANAPGKTPFNPLFIFGGPGLGKTHLAQAIGVAINQKYPDLVVLYVTGNEFKTQYMDATSVQNKLTDFMAFYNHIDVLIVDDIQDLLGQGSQNAFFNIFNNLHLSGKQLIFTSDRAPVDLQNFEERLLSRFKWGLSVELSRPDYATRLSMLKAKRAHEGLMIGDDVLEYLASHVKTNFRELEGAMTSVVAYAAMSHRDNDVELAAAVTDKLIGEEKHEISIDKVEDVVCDYFSISREELLSKTRRRQIVQARQIAMYICRNYISNCSLSTIGAEIGGKDHATVLHACSTVSDLMSTDRVFKKYVVDIQGLLSPAER